MSVEESIMEDMADDVPSAMKVKIVWPRIR